jgi:hypothetical protein
MAGWVMVPVPEEFEHEVQRYLMTLGMRAGNAQWDSENIAGHMDALDPDARALACAVARAVTAGGSPTDADMAAQLDVSRRELLALAQLVNEIDLDPSPGVLVYALRERDVGRSGDGRFFHMEKGPAALIGEWEDAHTRA